MMATQSTPNQGVSLNPEEILALFVQKRYDEVSEKLLAVLEHFRDHTLLTVSVEQQYSIDQFVKVFLFILSEPTFIISPRYVLRYLSLNQVISNVVAMSNTKTTDAYVEIVLRQANNLLRLLTIYGARNRVKLDRKAIFDTNASLASTWFGFYACSYYSALVSQVGWENLREHFSYSDPRLRIGHQIQETYFGSTYAGGDRDRLMKPVVNQTVREGLGAARIRRKTPEERKIAVLSAFWAPTTSVYRNYSSLVRSLKGDFHLTFVQIGETAAPETDLWDDVRKLKFEEKGPQFAALQDADFQVAYFPDVGMFDGSIVLANQRIAPIQVCSPGHSVSTFGAEIDYFMSGVDCEVPENAEKNYSERLVLMPGLGVVHNRPNYEFQGLKRPNPVLLVNLPAWCQKVNYPYVQTLKKIQAATDNRFKIRLFSGYSLVRSNDHIPFYRELAGQLGAENVEVLPHLPYARYMAEMERGDLSLDTFHFGGCNTVSDSLFARVPMICWEGDKWYNRIGPATLLLAHLPECIVTNEQEFVDLAVRWIDDEKYRVDLQKKLAGLDLDALIYRQDDAAYFNKAIHYLIDNHERLQRDATRKSIVIPRE